MLPNATRMGFVILLKIKSNFRILTISQCCRRTQPKRKIEDHNEVLVIYQEYYLLVK